MDSYLPLKIPAGLYKQGTKYQASGRWFDANLVRFSNGAIRPVGGWTRLLDGEGAEIEALDGVPRGLVSWETGSGQYIIGIGTTSNLYVIAEGALHDITPENFNVGGEDAEIVISANIKYGAGNYGDGPYGGIGGGTEQITRPGVWQIDVFGDYLVGIASQDGILYVWEGDPEEVATPAAGAPQGSAVVTTPERFVAVLGADGDVRKVAWASQEMYTVWTATPENSAGAFTLPGAGALMCGRRAKAQTLLWTTQDMWVMSYIGGEFIYRFDLGGSHCGTISPAAPVVVDTVAFWMGHENFFQYDGFTKPLPCEVHDYVFGDFNRVQAGKVWGTSVAQFGEVWWFYPSSRSSECDRYVIYNYREGHWSAGQLERAAGVDAGATAQPIFADHNGLLYQHEYLEDRGGASPFIESGPVELGNGDHVMDVQRIVPDERNLGEVRAKLYAVLFPTDTESEHGPYPTTAPTVVRVKARQVRLRLEEAAGSGGTWRVGTFRLGVVRSSRR